MDQKDYWQKVHIKYSQQDWSQKPNIFATEVIKYFPKTGRLLELGAGVCQDSLYFSSLGYNVTASDFISPLKTHSQFNYQIIDLNNPIPFKNNSFDIVYCHLGMHFFTIDRTKEIFNEIHNILNPNGVFCATFNSTTDLEISESIKIDTDYYQTPSGLTKRFFSPESLKQLLPKEFKIIILDDIGKTVKDGDGRLIRLVCQK